MSADSYPPPSQSVGVVPPQKPDVKRVPLGMAQRTMAKRMLQSVRDIPQFSVSWELDADQLAAKRSRINAGIESDERRVSVTALLIWLTARALARHPRMNSRYEDEAAIEPAHVNMAVAIDAPYGLVAPVIRNAETLTVEETALALRELASRAAAKKLGVSDFADATFTITNLGMFGVTRFIPIVNPPQGAIMGVGGPRTTVRTDSEGGLVAGRVIELTVTADHRILDGAEVARFLQTLANGLAETF